jgi:hypothetical protein
VGVKSAFDDLNPKLREVAELTGSLELLWPPAAAPEAVNWAQERELAILAVELFGRDPDTHETVYGEWPTESRRGDEHSWNSYVRRAAEHARESIRHAERLHSRIEHRRYFLALITEADGRPE